MSRPPTAARAQPRPDVQADAGAHETQTLWLSLSPAFGRPVVGAGPVYDAGHVFYCSPGCGEAVRRRQEEGATGVA